MHFQIEVNTVASIVAFTVLVYDYVLTFDREVEFFWKRPRLSWAFGLFIANRYITLFAHIPGIAQTFWVAKAGSHSAVCHRLQLFDQLGIVVIQLIGGAIMSMRVYAFYQKSARILVFLVTFFLLAISFGCWAVLFHSSSSVPSDPRSTQVMGCIDPITSEQALRLAVAWSGQLGFDAIIFALTLWKSLHVGTVGDRTLVDVLLRDGQVMTGANVANITAFLLAPVSSLRYPSTVLFQNSIDNDSHLQKQSPLYLRTFSLQQ
ncbi:hypothetical protein HYDPIDRAFT_188260 [Hydnomerulius pinastri MD-312]|uniref:DUF6533 domain-containing protein n=1 Tax=Hydnomerulius pinastri MD-312 TaxID=994086 RepID=A0A0C9VE53_9AGAM|nr:hypothetical protein HYDPIDRAFT_188260 [Hydnomerulius pinastri MD-312]